MRRTTDGPNRRTSLWVPDQPGRHAEPGLGKAKLDPALGNADVGDRRELQAAAKRVTGQRCYQGNAQTRERFESAVPCPRPVAPHLQRGEPAPGGDVAAGAKGLAFAGEDRNARVARGFDRAGGLTERIDHRAVERVQLFSPFHGQTRKGAFKCELDEWAH